MILRWPIAAKAPSAIEAMETKTTICCHSAVMPGKCRYRDAHEHRDARHFRRRGEEGRDRRRRAFIDVRRPHMERHGRDLEAEAGEQEDDAEDQPDIGRTALRRGVGNAGKAHRAGKAVDQRGAVKQHARRQRAEHEIFQARPRSSADSRDGWRRRRKAAGSSIRGRDKARSGRPPRSASACRASRAGSARNIRTAAGARARHNRATSAMAAAEPSSARIFRKRAKSSTTKLPSKAVSLPAGSRTATTPAIASSAMAA